MQRNCMNCPAAVLALAVCVAVAGPATARTSDAEAVAVMRGIGEFSLTIGKPERASRGSVAVRRARRRAIAIERFPESALSVVAGPWELRKRLP